MLRIDKVERITTQNWIFERADGEWMFEERKAYSDNGGIVTDPAFIDLLGAVLEHVSSF